MTGKPGFTVTTNDAAETVIVNDDPPQTDNSAVNITKPAKAGKGDSTNADTP